MSNGHEFSIRTAVVPLILHAITIFTEHGVESRTDTQRQQQPHQLRCREATKG